MLLSQNNHIQAVILLYRDDTICTIEVELYVHLWTRNNTMQEQAQPIIEAQKVHKIYHSGQLRVEALRKIDMVVAKGEMVAIMGPSGCGKDNAAQLSCRFRYHR